jgi:hypothetical protein
VRDDQHLSLVHVLDWSNVRMHVIESVSDSSRAGYVRRVGSLEPIVPASLSPSSPLVSHSLQCMRCSHASSARSSASCQHTLTQKMYRAAGVVEQSRLDPRVFGNCSFLEYSVHIVSFFGLWSQRWRRDCEINGLRPEASDGCLWSRTLGRALAAVTVV